MRRRFFITILAFLTLASASILVLHFIAMRTEQLFLIDRQIEGDASLLLSSGVNLEQLQKFEETESILREVFHGEVFNQFIIIRDSSGHIIYRSRNSARLTDRVALDKEWQTVEAGTSRARILTLYLKPQNVILQMGLLLSQEIWHYQVSGKRILLFSIVIILILSAMSMLLTRKLLHPLVSLSQYISYLAKSPNQELPASLKEIQKDSTDELTILMKSLMEFKMQVQDMVSKGELFSAQLAHEIKTPLTIMRTQLEKLGAKADTPEMKDLVQESLRELVSLNEKISNFLSWSASRNSVDDPLFALMVDKELISVIERLGVVYPNRIVTENLIPVRIIAGQKSLDYVLTNLIHNALKYSDGPVSISMSEDSVCIRDSGNGIPKEVQERLGQPFNKGKKGGTGLGLALVQQISQKYGWALNIQSGELGTEISVKFSDRQSS